MQVLNYDLSARNTFRMKVKCAMYVEIDSETALKELDWNSLPKPVMVMGGGSNLLFTKDFPGTVLHVGIEGIAGQAGNDGGTSSPAPTTVPSSPAPTTVPSSPAPTTVPSSPAPTGDLQVTCGAGVVFDDFCAWAAREGLWGPENLSLIPGECGASTVQNIGAYGVEAKDIITKIRAWDTVDDKFVDIDPADCEYGYRTSRFKTQWKGRFIITAVTYRLSRDPQPKLDYGGLRRALDPNAELTPGLIRRTIIDIRNAKLPDPKVTGSAGSFFCNPVISREHFERIVAIAKADNGPDCQVPHYEVGDRIKVPAAWMIEQCGFKGKRLGGAQVYQNQPLVIVNASGSALPEEIIGLENEVIQAIERKYGITLHPEVEHV